MHFVLITAGQGNSPTVQHLHHQSSPTAAGSRLVNLLVLDARHMSPPCLKAATRAVDDIRTRHGLRHGVLLCDKPSVPLVVAAIRCGLRDIITQYIGAGHLRELLRAAVPSIGRREYRDIVGLLRTFTGWTSGADHATISLAKRAEELSRRAEELNEQAKTLAVERDRLTRLDQDLRERTRRLDRQIARLQNDSDVLPGGGETAFAGGAAPTELAAQARRLEQRATQLDLREKMLNEMQALLLAAPPAAAAAPGQPAPPPSGPSSAPPA